ncbi:hypothetical protein SRIMM317S_02984 [Streptomyces rimosus subsp. rimosus]
MPGTRAKVISTPVTSRRRRRAAEGLQSQLMVRAPMSDRRMTPPTENTAWQADITGRP